MEKIYEKINKCTDVYELKELKFRIGQTDEYFRFKNGSDEIRCVIGEYCNAIKERIYKLMSEEITKNKNKERLMNEHKEIDEMIMSGDIGSEEGIQRQHKIMEEVKKITNLISNK